MSAKTLHTVQDLAKLNAAKEAARNCLLAADKFLKESQFELARQQLEKARELDPSNSYIYAFQDRITYFEEKKKKDVASGVAPAPTTPTQYTIPKPTVKPVSTIPAHPPEHKAEAVAAVPIPAPAQLPEEHKHRKEETASASAPQVDSLPNEEKKEPPPVPNPVEESKPVTVAEATVVEDTKEEIQFRLEEDLRKKLEEEAVVAHEQARKLEERKRQDAARKLEELRKKESGERAAAEEQKKRELEARAAAEEQRGRELEARVAAEEQRRKELEARIAADEERRREEEARAAEELRRRELEAKAHAEERRRRELEGRVVEEERKRKELEERIAIEEGRRRETEVRAAEEQRRRELEARAAAEEQKRKELEARIAAEEQRRRELEARIAAEEQRMREEIARKEEERRRKESESRASAEEQIRKGLEARVAEEEKRRKELEKRAAIEELRMKEIEAKISEGERRRKELEELAAVEERRRKEFEELAAAEERLRKQIEEKMAEELRRKEMEARAAEEQRKFEEMRRQEEALAVDELRRKELETRAAEEQRKLEELRSQVEELTKALEVEKKAREEITRLNLQNSVKQLRSALEAAWVNGAAVDAAANALHELAISLKIPPDVELSIIREVKLDMYSKAVKEVIAKRKLLRSSSSTLEWLRKVYQVSVAEYLENESKFLLDLVADQYKGTVLLVSKMLGTKEDITPRLKSSGFAVVQAATPENALEKIEKVNPNIVLCETDFPGGLSGVKFLHVIRANSKFNYIPFILVGEVAELAQLKSSELKPNEGVIKRPIDYEELTTLINEKLTSFREYISSMK